MGEQSDGKSSKDAGPPPVPLPTYLWEEIRRKKAKGTYPWTHVLKEPFDEEAWLRSIRGEKKDQPIIPYHIKHKVD